LASNGIWGGGTKQIKEAGPKLWWAKARPDDAEMRSVPAFQMKFGVLQFPGSCDEVDALNAARRVGDAELLWHGERDLKGADAVIVPGGFSYGDYLRAGAIARFAPVMEAVVEFAEEGGRVLGICNGFQVLCEARLLPGALLPNVGLRFVFRDVDLQVVNPDTDFTRACASMSGRSASQQTGGESVSSPQSAGGRSAPHLSIPAKHSWGRYYADEATLDELEANGQVVLRYAAGHNFNGSARDIAGVQNAAGNVFGLMPHPEHAVDALTGSTDGLCIFESMRLAVEGAHV
jgi:phosphoribosylformylglycinamidine synthase subunit PurQ / glutaminase